MTDHNRTPGDEQPNGFDELPVEHTRDELPEDDPAITRGDPMVPGGDATTKPAVPDPAQGENPPPRRT